MRTTRWAMDAIGVCSVVVAASIPGYTWLILFGGALAGRGSFGLLRRE